jgi:hypothetical protein
MLFRKLKHKLLVSAVVISLMVALACMLAVSWVISQQHLNQSHTLLEKASRIIEADLVERNAKLLAASRQLATLKNMGSTIWYLGKYARSSFDHETLFNTYGGLAKDIYEIGRVAQASSVAIYDSDGHLVTFATFDAHERRVGFVQNNPSPMVRYTLLTEGEELALKISLFEQGVGRG